MALRSHLDLLAISVRVPRGTEGFWQIIRDLDEAGTWTIAEICKRTNVHRRNVSTYVQGLAASGIATVVEVKQQARGRVEPAKVYRLNRRPIVAPRVRRDGTLLPETHIETLWRTMKIAKTFTHTELAEAASTSDRPVKASTAKSYLNELCAVGIICRIEPATTAQETRFRLVRNLGNRAPKVLSASVVFDPNANEVVGEAYGREVLA